MKCFFLSMVCYNRAIIGKEKTVTEVTIKVHFSCHYLILLKVVRNSHFLHD